MIDIEIEYHSGIPVYKQIIAGLMTAMHSGKLSAGDKLPPIRKLSRKLNVNPNTTAKVYRELELRGVVESKPGSGCFVLPQEGGPLSAKEKKARMEALFDKLILEIRNSQITEKDLIQFIQKRIST